MGEEQRKRGRPARSAQQRAEIRKRIEAAALELFRGEGYRAVSMRRLASEAGCSTMALYDYFDNKIDVLRALWAHVFDDLSARLENAAAAHGAEDRLEGLAIAYAAYWLAHVENYRMVFMAEGVTQPEVSVFIDSPVVAKLFSTFARAMRDALPFATESALKVRLDVLVSALHGIVHSHITMSGYPWTPFEELVRRAVRSALAGGDD